MGLFAKYGLEVKLCRELGWATIRDKVVYGELDAAQAVAGLALATTCGWGAAATPCVTGLILNANGNAITLSNLLRAQGVSDAESFRHFLLHDAKKAPVLGTVNPYSSHNILLRQWLVSGGINPDKDVNIVVVPPPQACQNLKAGTLDGFCVGEPWNSLAVQNRIGWIAATSLDLSRGHPEKVLLVREEFAEKRPEQHIALMAAALEACRWCDNPRNREELVSLLCRTEYLNLNPRTLLPSLIGPYDFGQGCRGIMNDFVTFHRNNTNDPTPEKVEWLAENLTKHCLRNIARPSVEVCHRVFRHDFYREAHRLAFGESNSVISKTKPRKTIPAEKILA